MKTCNKCRESKSLDSFGRRSSAKDGLFATCKECRSVYNKQWDKDHPESRRKSSAEWRKRNPGRDTEAARKRNFGLYPGEWELLFRLQGHKCKMCGRDDPGRARWHTDHDHDTGDIRGILCHNCNRGLGYLKDSPELLQAGIHYLNTGAQLASSILAQSRSTTPHLSSWPPSTVLTSEPSPPSVAGLPLR